MSKSNIPKYAIKHRYQFFFVAVVLVTGASGYLGAHCVRRLLLDGYKVRGTVRSLKNIAKVRPLYELASSVSAEMGQEAELELIEADLEIKDGWSE